MRLIKDVPVYYEQPFQVIYLRPDMEQPTYEKGIVYHETVIAARDGKVFSTKEIMRKARACYIEDDYAIVESFGWVPIDVK